MKTSSFLHEVFLFLLLMYVIESLWCLKVKFLSIFIFLADSPRIVCFFFIKGVWYFRLYIISSTSTKQSISVERAVTPRHHVEPPPCVSVVLMLFWCSIQNTGLNIQVLFYLSFHILIVVSVSFNSYRYFPLDLWAFCPVLVWPGQIHFPSADPQQLSLAPLRSSYLLQE